jgi:hypothetical protein
MTEKPILMDTASMEGLVTYDKNATRRTRGLDAINEHPDDWQLRGIEVDAFVWEHAREPITTRIRCPYGMPGDELWVREAWTLLGPRGKFHLVEFPADGIRRLVRVDRDLRVMRTPGNKPSILMPREVSRINLVLYTVSVQRTQRITSQEIQAEGLPLADYQTGNVSSYEAKARQRRAWIARWDGINADRGLAYARNVWHWALSFGVIYHARPITEFEFRRLYMGDFPEAAHADGPQSVSR